MGLRLPRIPDRLYRVLMGVLAVALVLAVVRLAILLGEGPGVQRFETTDTALSVTEAIVRAADRPLPVGGYLYYDGGFLGPQLCEALSLRPVRCVGPALLLRHLDLHRLDTRTAARDGGGEVRFTPEPVVLYGMVVGTEMRVQEILGG